MSLSAKDLTLDLAIRYGFQVLGALVILGVGLLLARWVGNLLDGWLEKRALEPPARTLMVRVTRITVAVKPWVTVDSEVAASGDLYRAVLERLRAAGIEVPRSRHDVRMLA